MDSKLQSKQWLNGKQNKTLTYAVYKKFTSDQKTHTESKGIEKLFHENGSKQRNKSWGSNTYLYQTKQTLKQRLY